LPTLLFNDNSLLAVASRLRPLRDDEPSQPPAQCLGVVPVVFLDLDGRGRKKLSQFGSRVKVDSDSASPVFRSVFHVQLPIAPELDAASQVGERPEGIEMNVEAAARTQDAKDLFDGAPRSFHVTEDAV